MDYYMIFEKLGHCWLVAIRAGPLLIGVMARKSHQSKRLFDNYTKTKWWIEISALCLEKTDDELVGRTSDHCFKLCLCAPSLSFHQSLSQTMVDSDSHTEIVGFSRNRRPLLQNYPWKQQRNLQHENGSHKQAQKFIP